MLMNLFVVWLLISVFAGSRAAGKFVRGIFGVLAFFWIFKVIFFFGFGMLPFIIIAVLLSNTLIPFVRGFVESFRR